MRRQSASRRLAFEPLADHFGDRAARGELARPD